MSEPLLDKEREAFKEHEVHQVGRKRAASSSGFTSIFKKIIFVEINEV